MTRFDLRRHSSVEPVLDTIVDVYTDVRAPLLDQPNYRPEVFAERLARHGAEPGWEAVLAYADGQAVGYADANTVDSGDRWWERMAEPLPVGFAESPTIAIKEIGVRTQWRRQGVARLMHDELLAGRSEVRATLLVNPEAFDGTVIALYRKWGYEAFNSQQPSPDSPRLTAMTRPRRLG
jgi:GNAT superfamily N-acetyltransferase